MIFLFMLAFLGNDQAHHIENTEIHQRMLASEIFIKENGEVYILNFDESRIQYYDDTGKLKKNIGRRGRGPGEFTFPLNVAYINRQFHVFDKLTGMISVFDDQGAYIEQFKLPSTEIELARAAGGWVFWIKQGPFAENRTTHLKWTDDNFKTSKVIMEISDQGWSSGTSSHSSSTGQRRIEWSPITVKPRILVSRKGETVYFAATPWKFEITVIDGNTGSVKNTITKDAKLIPFDVEWADERFTIETEEHILRKGISISDIDKLYPEHFPIIRSLAFDPIGNLVVSSWRGRPDSAYYLTAFNTEGDEVPVTYSWSALARLAGVAKGYGYITIYDDEEAALAKVPIDQIEAFVDENPIEDWSFSRSMSIRN